MAVTWVVGRRAVRKTLRIMPADRTASERPHRRCEPEPWESVASTRWRPPRRPLRAELGLHDSVNLDGKTGRGNSVVRPGIKASVRWYNSSCLSTVSPRLPTRPLAHEREG